MHEDEARRLLRTEAQSHDVMPVSGAALVARGRRDRRRRLLTVGAAAAAVAAVIAGGVVVFGDDGSPAKPPLAAEPLVPDPGHRFVGAGGVVVQVPASWSTNDVGPCGAPGRTSTVVFEPEQRGLTACEGALTSSAATTVVTVASTTSGVGSAWLAEPATPVNVDGSTIAFVEPAKQYGQWTAAIVAEDDDVVIAVRSPDRDVVDGVVGSVRLLPDGYLTVPPASASGKTDADDYVSRLEEAGLSATLVETPSPLRNGLLIRTTPALGSPVADGSTVTVVVSGDAEASPWPSNQMGPAIECVYAYPEELRQRANAFDATVTDVVEYPDETVGDSDYRIRLTMRVNEVFKGDADDTVTMQTWNFMLPPDPQSVVGTRVLAASGPSLEVMACGFTLPYTPEDAAEWRDVYQPSGDDAAITAVDRRAVDALTAFARDPSPATLADVPLATELELGLAGEVRRTVSNANLADPATWLVPGPFRAATGPFSALDLLAGRADVELSLGAHGQCGSGRALGGMQVTSPELRGLRQVSVQRVVPTTSCLDWWSVDLYLDGDGVIHGVTLDLWEP